MPLSEIANVFTGNPLDRASERRSDDAWIEEKLNDPGSLAVALWNGAPLTETADGKTQLSYLPAAMATELSNGWERLLFMGMWKDTAVFAPLVAEYQRLVGRRGAPPAVRVVSDYLLDRCAHQRPLRHRCRHRTAPWQRGSLRDSSAVARSRPRRYAGDRRESAEAFFVRAGLPVTLDAWGVGAEGAE